MTEAHLICYLLMVVLTYVFSSCTGVVTDFFLPLDYKVVGVGQAWLDQLLFLIWFDHAADNGDYHLPVP